MSVRAWGYVAALGLTFLGSAELEAQDVANEDQVTDETREAEPAHERAIEAPAPQVAPEPTEVPGPVHDATQQEDTEGDPDEDPWIWLGDGVAQWVMVFLGAGALAVSWWAVVLLKQTLAATRDAVKEAQSGTKAAQDGAVAAREANKIAAENAAIERRPWVAISDPEITSIHIMQSGFEGKSRSLWVEWEVKFKNVGLTPALAVRAHSRLGDRVADGWMQGRQVLGREIIEPLHPLYGFSLAPGEEQPRRFNATFDLDPTPIAQGGHASLSLGIHVAASYQEPVDETRRLTEATFDISHNRLQQRPTNVQPIYISPKQLAFPNTDAEDGNTHFRIFDVDKIEVRRVGGTMT